MKHLIVILFIIVNFSATQAQTTAIKGTVIDTLNNQKLQNAVISILTKKDSVLYSYTRSVAEGNFIINNIVGGKYIVLVTYPGYADYYDTINVAINATIQLGIIQLTTKAHLLEDVTVVQKIASVRMKGDTVVYKADSFKVKSGASVEDLLKQFPGIQVDKNGNITAQGTRVDKVLVDGEDFFGNDPTIATKNLNADMVNEVQVFDKKSDQATFTGIDDGQTSRTINLKLKNSIKKGWFGKMEVANGFEDRWNNNLMANSFKDKRKLSVFGIASSTGKTGLNWGEASKYGSASTFSFSDSDDGNVFFFNNRDELDNANYWGEGIPKSWNGGINYVNKFNNEKQQVNGNYKYAKLINEGFGTTRSQSILPDTLFFNNESRTVFGLKDKHSIDGGLDIMIDSFFSIKATINASQGNFKGNSIINGEALNDVGNFVNTSNRKNNSAGNNQNLIANILLRKKFKKVGRTLSLNINPQFSENNSEGFLYAENVFYTKAGTINFSDTTNQKKESNNKSNYFRSKLSYTEQLMKDFTVEVNYGFILNKFQNKTLSYDKGINGKYENLNKLYSNSFDYNINTNLIGTMFRYNKKSLNVSAGTDVAFTSYQQKDLIKDSSFSYNYLNLYPRINFSYKFNSNKRIRFNYNGRTNQPTIQQIQPIADNNNPMMVFIGNPYLRQEFNHSFLVNFNNYQVLKNRGYYLRMNFSTTSNAIRSNNFTDTLGKTISQYVNLQGNYNYGIYLSYFTKITALDLSITTSYDFNANNSVSIVNKLTNITNNKTHSFSINFSKEKEDVYNIWFYTGVNYNLSTSSIRPDINTKYWSGNMGLDFNIQLPYNFEINSEIETEFREKTPLFIGNNNVTVWNAYISKKITRNKKSEIRFSAYDILNQNKGYSRNIGSTVLTENTYQKLSQYFLLGFIWNFTKNGTSNI